MSGVMRTLAVTGGIGSGKSLVCSFLAERGFPVYDADSRTKALYDTDTVLLSRIRQSMAEFVPGGDVPDGFLTDGDGRLDRAALSSIVFSNADALAVLESIVYPAVLHDFTDWKRTSRVKDAAVYGTVVMESAIILEKPLFMDVVDMVLFVDAPVEVRMHRVMERDNARPEQVLARIRAQRRIYGSLEDMPAGTGFHILENTGSPALLRRKVDEFIDLNYRK